MKQKISVIAPCYNEEEVVDKFYDRMSKVLKGFTDYDYEMIFVNDGSKDNTLDMLVDLANKDENVKVVSFSRNFGHQAAVTAGMRNSTGDAVVIIDVDLQDPPETIGDMVELWKQGNDVVYAVRKTREGESKFKLMTAKAFYRLLNKLSDVYIPLDTGDFRLIDRKVVDVICAMPEHNKFLRGLGSWVGFKQIPYEYDRKQRAAGKTKYPLKKMLKLALDGMISFSTKPLKIIAGLGIFNIILSFAILVYALCSYIFELNTLMPGWASIMVTMTFMFGMLFIAIWILAEYISRIYDETRKRPEYIIRDKFNLDK